MKAIKDFDEREKLLYNKYRSQTLNIIIFELIIAIVLKSALALNSLQTQVGLLVLIAIPVIFYQIKMSKICKIDREQILTNFFLAIAWSIYYFYNNKNAGIPYCVVFLPWCLMLYSIYIWFKQRKDDEFWNKTCQKNLKWYWLKSNNVILEV